MTGTVRESTKLEGENGDKTLFWMKISSFSCTKGGESLYI